MSSRPVAAGGGRTDLDSLDQRRALRATAAEFVRREVAPHLQEWEDARSVPRELHAAAARQGLLGVSFSEDVGGEGGDLLDSIALQEGMFEAGASSGLMAALFTGGIALPHLSANGSAELVDRFVRPTLAGEKIGSLAVTEPGGGSDVARIRTTAVRDGDGYVVNGAKTFITSGVRADFVTTAVRTGPHDTAPGHSGISLLVIEKGAPGFRVDRVLTKMGWHCSDTAELSFVDVRVPVANLVGAENSGFSQIAEQFVVERIGLAVHAYGIAARSLALTAAYCRERETFGKPLIANQVVRHKLVEMQRQVWVARCYVRDTAARYVAGEEVTAEACLAKQTAVDCATYVCDQAVQLHGGTGYMHGTEVERHYRDARILPIGGGATEVLTDLAARLLGYASTTPRNRSQAHDFAGTPEWTTPRNRSQAHDFAGTPE
jgi:acyl-CoA dehydrogenase